MGNICCCCPPEEDEMGKSSQPLTAAEKEAQRARLVEAAEKRNAQAANKGIKDPKSVQRMKERDEARKKMQSNAASSSQNDNSLKWTTG
eukprot:Nk52_evm2s157 gene=Nk52_evmTU2s157